jgi:N-acetylglutamate synthase-like GNAT family acetyltransferase
MILADVKVRAAADADANAMTSLAYRAMESNGHSKEEVAKFADSLHITPERLQSCRFWAAEDEDAIIGCIALEVLERGAGEVRSFFIAPEHQGRGIGRRLIRTLETIAHTQGITRLQAHADPVSVKHYQNFGFRVEGTVPSRTCPTMTVPYMVWDI